jgi:hypothetical protein
MLHVDDWLDITSIPPNEYVILLFPNGLELLGAYLNFPIPSWGVEINGAFVALDYATGDNKATKPIKWKYQ